MFSKMKYYFMVFILTVFAPSFAAADNIDLEDLTFIFGDMAAEQTLELDQMELLSKQEMIDTEGEWFWFAAMAGYRMGRAISIYQRYHYGVWVPMAYRRFQTI
jgi:hypothetical protein